MSLDDNNSSISSISDNSYNNNNNNNNGGMVDAHRDLFLLYEQNHSIHQPWFTLFSLAYGILILLTFAGNSLVVFAVVRKKEMWSARNILILNLALSGLILCVTMVLTAMDVLSKYWPFGESSLMLCRFVKSSPCFAVYLCSFTIVIIALDRYRFIVQSYKQQLSTAQAICSLPFLYMLSFLMASPIFFHSHLHVPNIVADGGTGSNYEDDEDDYLSHLVFCIEDWNYHGEANTSTIQRENRRHVYSLFSLFVQYIIPFILITVIYSLIYWFLKQHRMVGRIDTAMKQRARRTNAMLISISLLYCFCWLPLNFFNVAVDIWDPFRGHPQVMICLFMSCHLLGMSSACINPILYGYLNDNFKAQFIEIFSFCCCGKKCAELPSEAARRRSHCPVQVTKAEQKSKQQRRRQRQQLRQPATAEETMAMVAVGADARAEDSCSRMSELKDESKVISEMQTKLKQTEM